MTKNQYEAMIYTYMQRKNRYKKMDKVKYADRIKKLAQRIKVWRMQIYRLEKRYKLINDLIKSINTFFDVNIRSRKMDTTHKLARNIFYKYGMENRLRGMWLSSAIGRVNKKTASGCRMNFTRSFKSHPQNKIYFIKFREFQLEQTAA